MKSVDFPETVSAKVTSRCKKLLEKHNISVRSAVEVGLIRCFHQKGDWSLRLWSWIRKFVR